jgi:hypothetical protein
MVQGSGWDTSTEIEVASIWFDIKINVWFNQAFKYTVHNFTPSPNCATSLYHSTNIHVMGHSTTVGTENFLFPQRPIVANMIAYNISKKETVFLLIFFYHVVISVP